jgi:hypothetical protein
MFDKKKINVSISCSNSFLLECSPVTQATPGLIPGYKFLSRVALAKDVDDLGLFLVVASM